MKEVYNAIFDRLDGQVTESVFDHVPDDSEDYPFLRLDPIQSQNNDTDEKPGFIAVIQVVGYSQSRGSTEISNLADSVYNALHRHTFADTVTYGISGIHELFRRISTQPDGLTRNSVQQFEIIFEPLLA